MPASLRERGAKVLDSHGLFPIFSMCRVLTFCLAACGGQPQAPAPEQAHYRDVNDRPLARLEASWGFVHAFFGDATPPRVKVAYVDRGPSQFDPEKIAVSISRESITHGSEVSVVAHETSHLALARLTRGASTSEALRFVDEG